MSATRAFSYHRAVAPMMWVLVSIAVVELAVVHLLVSLWNPLAALLLSIVSLAAIIWLVAAIAGMRRLPVLIGGDAIEMRAGRLKQLRVPWANIAGFRADFTAADVKAKGVLNLALLSFPNVMLVLDPPVPGRRGPVHAVAHRLDDPAGFIAALSSLKPNG